MNNNHNQSKQADSNRTSVISIAQLLSVYDVINVHSIEICGVIRLEIAFVWRNYCQFTIKCRMKEKVLLEMKTLKKIKKVQHPKNRQNLQKK